MLLTVSYTNRMGACSMHLVIRLLNYSLAADSFSPPKRASWKENHKTGEYIYHIFLGWFIAVWECVYRFQNPMPDIFFLSTSSTSLTRTELCEGRFSGGRLVSRFRRILKQYQVHRIVPSLTVLRRPSHGFFSTLDHNQPRT